MASAMTMYFQRGYRFMRLLLVLHRALRQERGDGAALHLDRHPRRHLEADVVVMDAGDLAEDAHRDHLVTLLAGLEHGLVLLPLLHLRADHDEVTHHEH